MPQEKMLNASDKKQLYYYSYICVVDMLISPLCTYRCNSRKMHYTSGKEGMLRYSVEELSNYYRITESQNSRGWKGPLWVI